MEVGGCDRCRVGRMIGAAMSDVDLIAALGDALAPTVLMQRVCDCTLSLLPSADGVAVSVVTPDGITYVCGSGDDSSMVGTTVAVEGSLSGLAVQHRRVMWSCDAQHDPRVDAKACRALAVASLVCVPLSRGNHVYGVLAVNSSSANAFTRADVSVLNTLADFLGVSVRSTRELQSASNQLIEVARRDAALGANSAASADEGASRYVMNVLNPRIVTGMDVRDGVQRFLETPNALSIVPNRSVPPANHWTQGWLTCCVSATGRAPADERDSTSNMLRPRGGAGIGTSAGARPRCIDDQRPTRNSAGTKAG
jgi:hypothetical protein